MLHENGGVLLTETKTPVDAVEITYNLFDLPTAQHKAGLAGLLLMIESMQRRRISPVLQILDVGSTDATFRFDPDSVQRLFDDLHSASWVEASSRTKWSGKKPKRVEEQADEEGKTTKKYIYDIVQPNGPFLVPFYPDGDGIWLRLWRDMLWRTLRGIPKTRQVYHERAEGRPSPEGPKCWQELVNEERKRRQGAVYTQGIASSVFVGAQDTSAEKVPFRGPVHENLLLHFWPLVSLVFVPRTFSAKGEWRDAGYVVAVPEPSKLSDFLADAKELLGGLDPAPSGFRPRAARIDLPAEGGLEYLYHLARHQVARREIAWSLVAVELYHLEKRGNSIRTLAAERVLPDRGVLEQYESMRTRFFNPIYKTQRIMNLLAGRRWHEGFDGPFNHYPSECFIGQRGKTPRYVPFFGNDVRRTFKAIEQNRTLKKGDQTMSDDAWDERLAQRVFNLVREYVNRKTEEKSGIKYETFKDSKDDKGRTQYPKAYREAREKVCSNAFLAMRGRRDEAFVEYFTGTICSVPQFLPREEFLTVTQALMTDWQKVKTLSMLSLSAASYSARSAPSQQEGESQ